MSNMTASDRKRYNAMDEEIMKWQLKKLAHADVPLVALVERIENLEKLTFWSLLCDAGEQGLTNEQREIMNVAGFGELYDKFQLIMKIK